MRRRGFLKFQAAAAMSLGIASLFGLPPSLLAAPSPDLTVVKGNPAVATRAAVQRPGGLSAFAKPGQKVVIKPDMSFAADVAKSHGSSRVSLSLKGQMGLTSDRKVMPSHYSLDTAIVDLCFKVKPILAVIDATRVPSIKGLSGPGKALLPGEIIASADPAAADAMTIACCERCGREIQPRQVAHIAQAHARGLGRMDIENLTVQRLRL